MPSLLLMQVFVPTQQLDQQQQQQPAVLLLHLAASLLQLRGSSPSTSPLQDSSGNVLCFNGEVFGGLDLAEGGNDGNALLAALQGALQDNCKQQQQQQDVAQLQAAPQEQQHQQQQQQQQQQLPLLLSQLRGPWSLIYWQAATRTLWFGRDWLGKLAVNHSLSTMLACILMFLLSCMAAA
jgi:asparagine synthetase B (glutamine-hydrolysing)